jgi:hypothetical protein
VKSIHLSCLQPLAKATSALDLRFVPERRDRGAAALHNEEEPGAGKCTGLTS